MSSIKVVDISEAQVFEDEGLISRRVIRGEHGSPNMSLNVSTLHQGYNDPDVTYPDHDEIVYMLSGSVKFTVDGEAETLTAGLRANQYGVHWCPKI